MLKIPLLIDDSFWVADLFTYDQETGELVDGGLCVLDNNSAGTVILNKNVTRVNYDWFTPETNTCSTDK